MRSPQTVDRWRDGERTAASAQGGMSRKRKEAPIRGAAFHPRFKHWLERGVLSQVYSARRSPREACARGAQAWSRQAPARGQGQRDFRSFLGGASPRSRITLSNPRAEAGDRPSGWKPCLSAGSSPTMSSSDLKRPQQTLQSGKRRDGAG